MFGKARQVLQLARAFDPAYYERANPDVVTAGMSPLAHFLQSGFAEGRDPSSTLTNAQLRASLGIAESDAASPAWQAALASGLYERVRGGLGGGRTRQPRKPRRRTISLPYIAASPRWPGGIESEKAALDHARAHPSDRLAFDFHVRFDPAFLRAAFPELADMSDEDLYLRWLESAEGPMQFGSVDELFGTFGLSDVSLASRFDHRAYLARYNDLPLTWSRERALVHFVAEGICEGRFDDGLDGVLVRLVQQRVSAAAHVRDPRASRVAAQLIALGFEDDRTVDIVADAANAHGMPGYVLDATSRSLGTDDRTRMLTQLKRADAYAVLGRDDDRVSSCHAAITAQPGVPDAFRRLHTAQNDRYDRARRAAVLSAEAGAQDEARHSLEAAADRVARDARFYGQPDDGSAAPARRAWDGARTLRVGLLADLFLPQCKLYRVDQKVEQLRAAGHHAEVFDFRKDLPLARSALTLFDVWIVYRTPALYEVVLFVELARRLGCPLIFEIDDLLFDAAVYPPPLADYAGLVSPREYADLALAPAMLQSIAKRCDFAIGSTPALAEALGGLVTSGRAFVHRNALGAEHLRAVETHTPAPRTNDTITVFYGSGTKAHKAFVAETFLVPLYALMQQDERIRFETVGYLTPRDVPEALQSRVRAHPPVWDVQAYWRELGGADINVAILEIDPVTDAKSEIKWLEAAMFAVPSIVSPTRTHTEVVNEGGDGLFAATPEAWSEALTRLCASPAERSRLGENARQAAFARYAPDVMQRHLNGVLRDALSSGARSAEA